MTIEQLKTLFKRYHFKPNFTYGQNFLIDDIVLDDIITAADLKKEDAVLEIGPGIGNLTEKLLQKTNFVLSIEKDPKFLPVLKSLHKKYRNFQYEIADILEYDFKKALQSIPSPGVGRVAEGRERSNHDADNLSLIPSPHLEREKLSYKVVANIPYYITGKILRMLLTVKMKPVSITLLTQKEVAQNIIAKAGDLSILAISVQIFGEPKIVKIVKPESFYPAPKVDSAILHINLYQKPKYKITNEKIFFQVVKACFAGKRKQIHNTLVNNLHLDRNQVIGILSELKINPAARPQELSIQQWINLTQLITNNL
jgi:16S rRNA (adenine1518-N6/adenine1519-N6)-dimethyltransferase